MLIHVVVQKKITRIGELTATSTSQITINKNKQKGNTRIMIIRKKSKRKKIRTDKRHTRDARRTTQETQAHSRDTRRTKNVRRTTDRMQKRHKYPNCNVQRHKHKQSLTKTENYVVRMKQICILYREAMKIMFERGAVYIIL